MTVYGYLRVSTDKQDAAAQKIGIEELAKRRGLVIEKYIDDEGVSGTKEPSKRQLGKLLEDLHDGDVVIASEISRLGRDLFMIMRILELCMKKNVKVLTVKDGYELGDNIQSKVLAFAFGLSAEIERKLISQRTKEGVEKRKENGVLLGCPCGIKKRRKLDPHIDKIREMLSQGIPKARIARELGVDRNTLHAFVSERVENKEVSWRHKKKEFLKLDEQKIMSLIKKDHTIPEIVAILKKYSFAQIYEFIRNTPALACAYKNHGMKRVKKNKTLRQK